MKEVREDGEGGRIRRESMEERKEDDMRKDGGKVERKDGGEG